MTLSMMRGLVLGHLVDKIASISVSKNVHFQKSLMRLASFFSQELANEWLFVTR